MTTSGTDVRILFDQRLERWEFVLISGPPASSDETDNAVTVSRDVSGSVVELTIDRAADRKSVV